MSSSTFNNDCLCSSGKSFRFSSVEVWGVGGEGERVTEAGVHPKSVLDSASPEAKAVLEMMGKKEHSQGLREPEVE